MELPHHLKNWSYEEEKLQRKIMKKKELEDLIYYETDEEILLMDGFEEAFIGFSKRCGQPTLATYSYEKMLQVLIERDEMDIEEADEYIMYNCEGAWMGELTPIILHEYNDPWKA